MADAQAAQTAAEAAQAAAETAETNAAGSASNAAASATNAQASADDAAASAAALSLPDPAVADTYLRRKRGQHRLRGPDAGPGPHRYWRDHLG